MRVVILSFLVVLFSLFASFAFPLTKPTVVVVGFDVTVPGLQYEPTLPAALTDLMINALINSNRFRVFERRKLDALVTEQGFQHFSGLVDSSTAVQLGRMVGARFVVTGSVTGLSSRSRGGVRLGPVTVGSGANLVTLTVRIIDVETGEILYSEVKQKKATRSTVGLSIGSIDFYSRTSQDIITAVNLACQEIVATFVERMDQQVDTFVSRPPQGYVVQVKGNIAYLNLGKSSGIVVGDLVYIFHPGEVIVDPKTGEVLDQELVLVAEARVTRVKERISEAVILKKVRSVSPEDVVEVVGKGETSSLPEWGTSLSWVATPEEESFEEETFPPSPSGETSSLPTETVFEDQVVYYHREFYPKGELKLEYTYYLENNKRIEHGTFTKWYENGKIMIQGTYRRGEKDGLWKECLQDGSTTREGMYQNGIKEGLWTIFYPSSGKKHFEGMYRNGKKDGEWIEYGGDGSILVRIIYENGKVVKKIFPSES